MKPQATDPEYEWEYADFVIKYLDFMLERQKLHWMEEGCPPRIHKCADCAITENLVEFDATKHLRGCLNTFPEIPELLKEFDEEAWMHLALVGTHWEGIQIHEPK